MNGSVRCSKIIKKTKIKKIKVQKKMQVIKSIKKIVNSIANEIKFSEVSRKNKNILILLKKSNQMVFEKWLSHQLCEFWCNNTNLKIHDYVRKIETMCVQIKNEISIIQQDFVPFKKQWIKSIKFQNSKNQTLCKNIDHLKSAFDPYLPPQIIDYFCSDTYVLLFKIVGNTNLSNKIHALYETEYSRRKSIVEKMISPDFFTLFDPLMQAYGYSLSFCSLIFRYIHDVQTNSDPSNIKYIASEYVRWHKKCKDNQLHIAMFVSNNESDQWIIEKIKSHHQKGQNNDCNDMKILDQFLKTIMFDDFFKQYEYMNTSKKLGQIVQFYKENQFDIVVYKVENNDMTPNEIKIHNKMKKMYMI